MSFEDLFLNYVNSMSENEIEDISKSRKDIYWDKREFYLWPHQMTNHHNDFKVFDSAADEDFDAKASLLDYVDVINDVMGEVEGAIEAKMQCVGAR